jgi:hypothetical protein
LGVQDCTPAKNTPNACSLALQDHAAQFAKRLDAECSQVQQNGEAAHE